MASRDERLYDLRQRVRDYVKQEKKRLEAEAQALEAILKGRTNGAGAGQMATAAVQEMALQELSDYLREK